MCVSVCLCVSVCVSVCVCLCMYTYICVRMYFRGYVPGDTIFNSHFPIQIHVGVTLVRITEFANVRGMSPTGSVSVLGTTEGTIANPVSVAIIYHIHTNFAHFPSVSVLQQ